MDHEGPTGDANNGDNSDNDDGVENNDGTMKTAAKGETFK